MNGARRLTARLWRRLSRRALTSYALWLAVLGPTVAAATTPVPCAEYTRPTQDYAHCVLGDCVEYRGLVVHEPDPKDIGGHLSFDIVLPDDHVFEDITPLCLHTTTPALLDGPPRYLVVETSMTQGGSLALYGVEAGDLRKIAETVHIGQRNRWLAPIGAADFDGDGRVEYAFVDRPHLAKTLRIVRQDGARLVEIAALRGVTNHRIGEDFITGGVRWCGESPEMLTVDARWQRIIATRFRDGQIAAQDIGPFRGQDSMRAALSCE